MPEPFKNLFNQTMITAMANHFQCAWQSFDKGGFIHAASDNLEQLELKQRSEQIKAAMLQYFPDDFAQAGEILQHSLHPDDNPELSTPDDLQQGLSGWAILPMTAFVAERGLANFDYSLLLLKEMSKRFTAEFAIRFFIVHDQQRCLSTLLQWTQDPNRHVRRLVSEGSRPRLPWGMRLQTFVADPAPLLPLLEALKDDPEDYVRRSVANSLNDIAKDHPDLVAELARTWSKNASAERAKLIRHACRTLIKQGHRQTLMTLGFNKPRLKFSNLSVTTAQVILGEALLFELELQADSQQSQNLVIDYAIHHRKKNGSLAAKVFKWKTLSLDTSEAVKFQRRHVIKPITTRVYYAGIQKLEILVNGVSVATTEFELQL